MYIHNKNYVHTKVYFCIYTSATMYRLNIYDVQTSCRSCAILTMTDFTLHKKYLFSERVYFLLFGFLN